MEKFTPLAKILHCRGSGVSDKSHLCVVIHNKRCHLRIINLSYWKLFFYHQFDVLPFICYIYVFTDTFSLLQYIMFMNIYKIETTQWGIIRLFLSVISFLMRTEWISTLVTSPSNQGEEPSELMSSRKSRIRMCNLVLVSKYENSHMIISISSRQVSARKIILDLVSKNCTFFREWDSKSNPITELRSRQSEIKWSRSEEEEIELE